MRTLKISGLAKLATLLAVVGPVVDHLSTRVVLSFSRLFYEANPVALRLMEMGVWLPFDVVLVILSVIVPTYLAKRFKLGWTAYTYSLLLGGLRLLAGVWNIALLFFVVVI